MADEQQQDRTEQATPKRRQEARNKGDVPRSRELTMTGVMLAGSSALFFMIEPMSSGISSSLKSALSFERAQVFDANYLKIAFAEFGRNALNGMIPLAVVLLVAVFLGAVAIGGWSFSASALAFKGERINPLKGIKRVFSANSLNELIKAMAKFLLVALLAIFWLWTSMDELLGLAREPIASAIPHALKIAALSFVIVSAGLILISAADVPFQLWNYQKKIRMTRKEVRDEFKETEGQPEVKSKIRMLQQQVANRRMMEEVPNADVVITNPTHFAVALKYDEATMGAPKVVAKGKDHMAKRIREVAEANQVPLFSAPPLARALYRSADIGQEITPGLYTAVAQVLAYIFQIDAAADSRGAIPAPVRPVPDIDESQF
jgi:flagellar biosynthesis protein FlhB